jgi:pilus assembly protein FimV
LIAKSHRWQRTAIAAAALALLGLSATEVSALSLGRITVQSALGEPLKAEIEVPNISTEEAASLRANVALPAAFVAAGLEYNPAMASLQATLARRADGRSFIRLSSDRPINDPFVDMILEASWSSGRIVRDYTMLFDPPSLKQPAPAPTLAQTAPAPTPTSPAPVAEPLAFGSVPIPLPTPAPIPAKPGATSPVTAPAGPLAKATAKQESHSASTVVVKAGDSASKIAMRAKTSDISLDQMLVALLNANPDAFSKGNLNRLRAGAVLALPSAEQAKAVSAADAAQTVVAQSKDFDKYRRSLADMAPKAVVETADRQSAGKLEAKVEDKKPTSAAIDKLTLSKGALQTKADEAKLAKERADKDAEARATELAKNIADLNKLSIASETAAPAAATPASSVKPVAPTPAVEVAQTTATPALPATAASVPAKPMPAPVVAQEAEPDLADQLMENPALPTAAVGLLALLGGLASYRRHLRKKRATQVDSSFMESRLQPDSFFGASGGEQVDTAQGGSGNGSSLAYSHSQAHAADDVDPVAEADVYLAYGRDMQAEEILKEALRNSPARLAIHTKLLEIYAKRRDAASFLSVAKNAFKLVDSGSPEWARICAQGLAIDPENRLYQPGGAAVGSFSGGGQENPLTPSADNTVPASVLAEMPHAGTDLDLDLDFSEDEQAATHMEAQGNGASVTRESTEVDAQDVPYSTELDFDISSPAELQAKMKSMELPPDLPDLSLAIGGLDLDAPPEPQATPGLTLPNFESAGTDDPELADMEVEEAPAAPSDGMLEFDLGSLSLDLVSGPPTPVEDESMDFGDNSLETKLALAEEFVSIGDHAGARALIEEVVAEATGALRAKAQRALAQLS